MTKIQIFRRIFFAVLIFGFWWAQTDGYSSPPYRPHQFVYGWPICFGTCRDFHFHFLSFGLFEFCMDVAISIFLIIGAMFAGSRIFETFPRFSFSDLLALTFGVSLLLWVVCGSLESTLETLGVINEKREYYLRLGDFHRLQELPGSAALIVGLSIVLNGYLLVCFSKRKSTIRDETRVTQGH